MKQIEVAHTDDLPKAASDLLAFAEEEKVFVFYGEMGAGKTTFIQQICRQLQATSEASSPTYALVNEYSLPDGSLVFHLDLYRLNDLNEAYDIGIEDYLYSGHYCLIEWPQLIEPLLETYIKININLESNQSRSINMTKIQL